MNLRLASHNDLTALVRARLDFCREMFAPTSAEESARLESDLETYFREHLGRDCLAVLAEDDGEVAAMAFLILVDRPASPAVPSGRVGEVGNVLTYPGHRRRGLATAVMRRLIEEADHRGVSRVDLAASPAGRKVYEKLGFTEQAGHTRMQLPLRPAGED